MFHYRNKLCINNATMKQYGHAMPTQTSAANRSLLDILNVGFMLLDMNDNILDVNETFLKMTTAPRDMLIGRHLSEFLTREEYNRMKVIDLALQKDPDYQLEFYYSTASGEKVPALFSISTNMDEKGRPVSQNVMVTDIRIQKSIQDELEAANRALQNGRDTLEREKKKLEAILFGIGDCVTVFDAGGNLLLSNPKGREIRGQRRIPMLHADIGKEQRLSLKIGPETREYSGRIDPVYDERGELFAFIETLQDITDTIRLEQRERELNLIKREIRHTELKSKMIGVSREMIKVFDLITRCAEVDSTILILGETGVGKEMAARLVHSLSDRQSKPFVAVNCGALPEPLLESELFGHVKGAFTGAISDRPGLFRESEGGTLFLDEVADLPPPLQVKLLRVLQEKEIRPVGGGRSYPVDVRIMAAANIPLEELARREDFRKDLYYRLAVIPLNIPPLRERTDDILPLMEHFIRKHRKKDRHPAVFNHAAQQALMQYSWPGNIRELENAVEHALAMSRETTLKSDDLPVQVMAPPRKEEEIDDSPATSDEPVDEKRILSAEAPEGKNLLRLIQSDFIEAEKQAILEALKRHNGNRGRAAAYLGVSRSTLWRKMVMYGLEKGSKRIPAEAEKSSE